MRKLPAPAPRLQIRRDGFAGQHLVVLPAPLREEAIKHPLLRGLLVTDAGYFPAASGHRVERPQGASTHLLIVCLHGEGWIRSGENSLTVSAGHLGWIPADTPHSYGASHSQPWTIVWTHFLGDEVSAWQKELDWTTRGSIAQFEAGIDGATSLGLDKVYARLQAGYSLQHLVGASIALRATLCAAVALAHGAGQKRTAAMRTAAVREDISVNPARAYRLEELATAAGLSIPHFCLLFRRQTGFAPIDFLIRERIRKACRLLDQTTATIASIASEVGFEDPYYFSRCFHRIMRCSPRAYRKSVKG